MSRIERIATETLQVACRIEGPAQGVPVVLLHGFPYDAHAYDEVVPILVAAGHRVIVPWLRGYGATRFRSAATMRSGEQAALGHDLLELLDALQIERAVLAGYDWGGRAACVVAALWPARVLGLVSANGYNIQHLASAMTPQPPDVEWRLWYQYYFHSERGRAGLARYRGALCRQLWQMWSPTWAFDEATYARTAAAFDNPDFVDVVVHSYRHRYGLVEGDPAYARSEQRLAQRPPITVPTIVVDGADDGVIPIEATIAGHTRFTAAFERRLLSGVGHNVPQEAPRAFADAVLDLRAR